MSKPKEPKQKKERSKRDWKQRKEFLEDLLEWWKQLYPKPTGSIKRYMTGLRKRITACGDALA